MVFCVPERRNTSGPTAEAEVVVVVFKYSNTKRNMQSSIPSDTPVFNHPEPPTSQGRAVHPYLEQLLIHSLTPSNVSICYLSGFRASSGGSRDICLQASWQHHISPAKTGCIILSFISFFFHFHRLSKGLPFFHFSLNFMRSFRATLRLSADSSPQPLNKANKTSVASK